jgi:DNA uptake protein ComE-like DNA-binding protein
MKTHIFAFVAGLGLAGAAAAAASPTVRSRIRQGSAGRHIRDIDLNTAEAVQLARLPGMNMGLAGRVIENRPYRSKLDLLSRMVVPQYIYRQIRSRVGVSEELAHAPIDVAQAQ